MGFIKAFTGALGGGFLLKVLHRFSLI